MTPVYFCRSIAIEMGGVSRSGVDVTFLTTGAHSPKARSSHLLKTPFSEPLLRTLVYCKTHTQRPLLRTLLRTLPQNPSRKLLIESVLTTSMSKQWGFTKFSVFLKRVSLLNPGVRTNFVAFPLEKTRKEPRSWVRFWAATGV